MKILLTIGLFIWSISITFSQEIQGTVTNVQEQPIVGALVRVKNTSIGGFTDETGSFQFVLSGQNLPLELEASFIGYQTYVLTTTTLTDNIIVLTSDAALDEVVVEGRRAATDIDPLSAKFTEVLAQPELQKAACCNLSESFENNATVDINYSDAISGSKQISMLGLDGIYTQINWENMPLIRGVGEYYGMSFVPGTWIDQIQVNKGAGSVINGYESMAGQINVEFKKPDTMEKFYLNAYQNIQGRSELNSDVSLKLNPEWSTALFFHGNLVRGDIDGNDDGFIDRNTGQQVNVFNRWKFVGKNNLRSQFGIKYLNDERIGGQLDYDPHRESNLYGVKVNSQRTEIFAKNGLIFPEKPWKSIGLIMNGSYHNQEGLYGVRKLNVDQKSIYTNLIYQTIISDTRHKIKTGVNFQWDDIDELAEERTFNRVISAPGVFVEYEYDDLKAIKLIAGLRSDYISNNVGLQFSPRIHFKWSVNDNNSVRLSAGRGFRVPNIFTDDPGMLASSREVIAGELPAIESSWNYGGGYTNYFKLNGHDGTLSTTFYRTEFQHQLIRDNFSSAHKLFLSDLDGTSYANSLQLNLDYEVFDRFDVRLAYKYDDVKQSINKQLIQKQLTPKHRGLLNMAYALPYNRWQFDFTTQYVGKQRLPATLYHTNALENKVESEAYFRFNGQVMTQLKKWSLYAGGENLANFRQEDAIIDAQEPFGNNFDATVVWGPITGRNIYFGLRYQLDNKK